MRFSPAALLTAGCLFWPLIGHAEQKAVLADPARSTEIRQLIQDLGDVRFPVRQRASSRLQAIGLDALPALQDATADPDPEVRQRAWQIINGWAAEGKVPALLFQLSCKNPQTRVAAADTLGKMGAAARTAIPALTRAAQDKFEIVRCCAREALKNIQAQPEVMVEVVTLDTNVKIGGNKRYQIEVSNSGTASATNLRFIALVPQNLTVIGGIGVDHRRDGQRILTSPLELAPNSKVRLELSCKVMRKGHVPLQVEVLADQLAQPLRAADNLPAQIGTAKAPVAPQK